MKTNKVITEEDVQKALQKFVKKGGLIKKLPDELISKNPLVGAKFGIYEQVGGSSAVSSDLGQ